MYDKHTGNLIGYTDLGEVNNHLLAFQRMVDSDVSEPARPAKSILAFMVKGLFTELKFPYVQFSCTKLTGDCLFQLFWEVVKRLERIGLRVTLLNCKVITLVNNTIIYDNTSPYNQVLGATLDGATNNRRMIKLHNTSAALTYKVKNVYANDGNRELFFFSDPPHLLKTTRNCWASKCRFMWVSRKLQNLILIEKLSDPFNSATVRKSVGSTW